MLFWSSFVAVYRGGGGGVKLKDMVVFRWCIEYGSCKYMKRNILYQPVSRQLTGFSVAHTSTIYSSKFIWEAVHECKTIGNISTMVQVHYMSMHSIRKSEVSLHSESKSNQENYVKDRG